uniref:Uncharacterized protein n=1 Tax=Oreochromis niloticus TaxID=8128 RepID=A0A669EFR4_ORENI
MIRLAGSTRCSGRVEVHHNNSWGTVCDDGWDLNDAEVVCRELNCGSALKVPTSAHFRAGTGKIWLDHVTCSGNESSLTECQHSGFGSNTCERGQDAAVICSAVSVILTGSGSTRCSGRVEVYHNNSWGTVCDDGWGLNDAEVVCRQLNCGSALEAPQSAHFGAGTGQIWLDHVTCSGNESSLTECQHSGFGSNTCEHGQDAAVICSAVSVILTGSGSTRCSGRVEVYHNNSWGTVCDDGWGLNDAEVVCRQLNCGSALEAPQSAHFGAGTGQIWLDHVTCSGNESSLTECQHSGFGSNTCEHGQDAAVICSDPVRLAGSGSTRCSGRVEIFHNNIWGTVSDYKWNFNDAEVVCRQLNCGSALENPQFGHFGAATGQIWLSDVTCSGNEGSLTECQHSGWGNNYYGHYYDVGVICSGMIRLAGSTRCSGRVEVYHNNSWGTVCDDGWDLNDAEVVCRQLNCGSALKVPTSAHFGAGTGQRWLDHVTCSGNETSLTECQHSGFGSNTCERGQDAAVICSAVSVILTGSTRCSGRVEVYHNNSWGTVCDDGWDLNDAEVVCRQLNCGSALEAPRSAHFGAGTGQTWLDHVTCSGNESSLTECQHSGFGSNTCEHGQDAAVICSDLIRLAGSGSTRCSGRVEIFHNNIWGTVSDYNWNLNNDEVVCRQLKCGTALENPQFGHFGEATGQIWLSAVTCSGNESSLTECRHSGWGNNYYGQYYDVGVICSACGRAVENSGSGPWQVSINHNGQFWCGGSLITNQWVLTAASCISHNLTEVHLSCHTQSDLTSGEVSLTVEDIICHPAFNNSTYENDICLLKLSAPVTFTDYIQPICLASQNSTFYNGTSSWVTDFSETGNSSFPNILQEVNAPVVGNNECQCYYEGDKAITENMICAMLQARKDSCQGNPGGPLMTKTGFAWVQSGVVSTDDGCAQPVRPAVFTRVSEYQNWISDTVTGMKPNFVTFTSPGTDNDLYFTCPTLSPPTVPTTVPTTVPSTVLTTSSTDDSVFDSGENLTHFTHFASLCLFAVLLHVVVTSSGM